MKKIVIITLIQLLPFGICISHAQWVQTNGPYGGNIWALAINGENIFAGTYEDGIFLSTDEGSNWTEVNNGLDGKEVRSLAISGETIFAGTRSGLFISTNNGANWTNVIMGSTNPDIRSFAISGNNIFAGTWDDGVFLSTDNGTSWNAVNNGLPMLSADKSLAIIGDTVFVGILDWNGGVYLSTDNGSNWNAINAGLTIDNETNAYALSLGFSENNIFAGTRIGIWRRPLTEIITGIDKSKENMPAAFLLGQNYPNPFNPTTTINFSIPKNSYVFLKIFNDLGKEVRTLVNGVKPSGNYQIEFDASTLPSGVYYYRLQCGDFAETKKLILLR